VSAICFPALTRRNQRIVMHRRRTLAITAALLSLAATTPLRAQAPKTVTVYTADYSFTAPDTISSGATTFHLVNRGPSEHHLVLFALPRGMTVARFDHLMRTDSTDGSGSDGTGILKVGGMDLAAGRSDAVATVDLAPGTYVLTCLLPLPDHSGTHRMRGMYRGLTVVPTEHEPALPPADVVVRLADYAFDMPAKIKAGRHPVRFENVGAHPHMAIVRRMAEGKTLADEVKWVQGGGVGPEPTIAAGGATDLAPGRASINEIEFTPGRYLFVCGATEGTAPKLHFEVGMFRELIVE